MAVLGHHTNILIIEAGFLIIWRLYNTTMEISEGVIHRGRTFIASIRSMLLFDSACLSANLGDKGLCKYSPTSRSLPSSCILAVYALFLAKRSPMKRAKKFIHFVSLPKQLNLLPSFSRLTVQQSCCMIDIISIFQIWSTVAGYDELCVWF